MPTILIFVAALAASCTLAGTSSHVRPASDPITEVNSATHEFERNNIPLKLPLVEPSIVVNKAARRLMLYSNGELVRTYRVGLGLDPTGDKVREGDRRTPEGTFYVFTKNDKSAYYLSLALSYPNSAAAERGFRDRLIDGEQRDQILNAIRQKAAPPQHTALGGEIYIHGNGSERDWTWGCVALDDNDIRELFDAVPVGIKVKINP